MLFEQRLINGGEMGWVAVNDQHGLWLTHCARFQMRCKTEQEAFCLVGTRLFGEHEERGDQSSANCAEQGHPFEAGVVVGEHDALIGFGPGAALPHVVIERGLV